MNLHSKMKIGCAIIGFIVISGLLPISAFGAKPTQPPNQVAIEPPAPSDQAGVKLQVLEMKVDLLAKVNEQTLQSVYWTLATLAAIFLGLISVNLYFNISANKREIEKIREDVEELTTTLIAAAERKVSDKNEATTLAEIARAKEEIANLTTSLIKTSEVNLVEKTAETMRREIEKSITTATNTMNSQILLQRTEINAAHEASAVTIKSALSSLKELEKKLAELTIDVKELEIFKYSQKSQMGAIYGHIELLEYDLANRRWNLKYRLPEIRDEITNTTLDVESATKLKELLAQIKDEEFKDIVEKIGESIVVKEPATKN